MAKDPMEPGTMVGVIKTPMCSTNVGRQNTPKVKDYSGTFTTSSPGGKGMKTGSDIQGPGEKGKWPGGPKK